MQYIYALSYMGFSKRDSRLVSIRFASTVTTTITKSLQDTSTCFSFLGDLHTVVFSPFGIPLKPTEKGVLKKAQVVSPTAPDVRNPP